MSREDQINAHLASEVDPKIQRMALKFLKRPNDKHEYRLSEDEAIIMTDRIVKQVHADQHKMVYLAGGISIACVLAAIAFQSWAWFFGVVGAIGFAAWRISEIRGSLVERLIASFDRTLAEKSTAEQIGGLNSSDDSPFDVPPQP